MTSSVRAGYTWPVTETLVVTWIAFNFNCVNQSQDPEKQELCVGGRTDRSNGATPRPGLQLPPPQPYRASMQDSVGQGSPPQAWAHWQCGKATGKEDEGFGFR